MSQQIIAADAVLATQIRWARSWRERSRGLLDGGRLGPGEALILTPAHQVHTFGLDFEIDVIFCDRHWRVIRVVHRLKPRRVTRPVVSARSVVELPGGVVAASVERGMKIEVVCVDGGPIRPGAPRRLPS